MKIQLRGDHLNITEALRDYVDKKIGRLVKYFDTPPVQSVQVTLSVVRDSHNVEVTMPINGILIRAEERSSDMYASIDLVAEKLERQIRKHKTKLNRRFREEGIRTLFVENGAPAPVAVEEAEEGRIVRVKKFAFKPMTPEEAVMQMDLLGHDFYVFANAETEEVNVVYKRHDGNYGLIEPEF
ncbi:ribosome hibernation-promoting factor, HPF/YfiA family [Effusibacillus lacus]|uniref:Ribosome hibernation promoting factor n=1 Tax=Effusibacillus lacus TaxID=1348429 RepID=A0A292YD10_9BACL|nr:ribosome-associated translation inhibitor RaiA [Effusibacillus lacus]TCS67858.1 putative sigma-54 modulation protein [Effusibacillus lacus]GAX89682.1 sigma-54 modulation protein [Effusibacillus lacus]